MLPETLAEESHEQPSRIARNFAALTISDIAAKLLALAAIVYLAPTLGPGPFGNLSFALAILSYFMLVPNAGLPLWGTREIANDEAKTRHYVNNILTLRLTLAIVGFGLLALLAVLLPEPLETKRLLILFGLALFPSALLFDWVFQGIQRMEFIGIARVLQQALYLGLLRALVEGSEQLLTVPMIYIAALCAASIFLLLFFVRRFGIPRLEFDFPLWKTSLRQALPMGFAFIMVQLYMNFDIIMLQFLRDEEEVGYYSAAYRIILFFIGVAIMYNHAIFPVVSRQFKTSVDAMRSLLSASTKLMVILALPLAVGGTILARPIMNLLYGSEYDNGIIAFQLLIWVVAIIFVSALYSHALIACGRQNIYARVEVMVGLVNLALNFALIPPYGLMGAAIATLVTSVVGFSLMRHFFSQTAPIPIMIYLPKPAFACIGMALFLCFCPDWNVALLVVSGAALYFLALLLLGGVSRNDISLVWDQLRTRNRTT